MGKCLFKCLLVIYLLTPLYAFSAIPASSALNDFVAELERMGAPSRMVKEAATRFGGFKWDSFPDRGGVAYYNRMTAEILVDETFKSATSGTLKPARELSPGQLTTLFHEVFHCFYQRVAEIERPQFFRYMIWSAEQLYASHEQEIQEEAYALFGENVVGSYLSTYRAMETKTPEGRERLRNRRPFTEMYERSFVEAVHGYYGNPYTGRITFTEVNLPLEDRKNFLNGVLDSQLQPSFKAMFAESRFPQPVQPQNELLPNDWIPNAWDPR